MIGIAYSMIRKTWSALPFTNERTDHRFTRCADQDFPVSKTEPWWLEAHDRHCLSPMKELSTTLRYVLIKIVLPQKTETRWVEAHDRHCLSPMKELITTSRYVLIKIFLCQRRKLDDSKDMIGIAYSMIRKTWSALPFTNERTDHRFARCADQDFPVSKTEPWWLEAHDRHCLSSTKELITTLRYVLIKIFVSQRRKLDDLKHTIGISFHQWKNWSPLYDLCRSRISVLKDGNSMMWSTWSALPFTNERTDHRFTICAEQDFPVSKTETRWCEAHDRRCLSPVKELVTTLRYVLNKISFLNRRKLDDVKHIIGIAFQQWKNWSPLYDMCWSKFPFLKDGNSMIWSTWSALPFTIERNDHHFTICAEQDFLSQSRKLDDLKHMIGIAFHQCKN